MGGRYGEGSVWGECYSEMTFFPLSNGLLPRFLDFINKYEAVLKVLLAR